MCQVNFAEPMTWNVATPGAIFAAISADYPVEPEAQEQVEAQFRVESDDVKAANLSLKRGSQRYLYRDASRSRVLVINAHLLSVNSLSPYEGWPALRARFTRDVGNLSGPLILPPASAVSLRYINRFVIPDLDLNTDDYFKVPVRTAQEGNAYVGGFLNRVESLLRDNVTSVFMTFASLDAGDSGRAFLLDLEVRRLVQNLSWAEALEVADELKAIENREFESLITDKCRELLQ